MTGETCRGGTAAEQAPDRTGSPWTTRTKDPAVSKPSDGHQTVSTRRVVGVLGGLGLGVIGGFVGSLLRSRPPTIYATGLKTSEGDDGDRRDDGRDESEHGLPTSERGSR